MNVPTLSRRPPASSSSSPPVQDGRIHIENQRAVPYTLKGSGSEFGADAVEKGWLMLYESGLM